MRRLLTFIIPVRHQDNARDWSRLKSNLSQTIASISAQTGPDWGAVIVANHGADLPPLPDNFEVVRVDYPPNPKHDSLGDNIEDYQAAVRIDKGRRILSGMLSARGSRFFMIVDDDDLIRNDLVDFVSRNRDANGWKIRTGYVWGDGGKMLLRHRDFHDLCGTSLIVRTDLYRLPNSLGDAADDYIRMMLGSHRKITGILAGAGTPLSDLPFPGAIYRVGHPNSHSKSRSLLRMYFLNRQAPRHPALFLRNVVNVRFVTQDIRRSFFGAEARSAEAIKISASPIPRAT